MLTIARAYQLHNGKDKISSLAIAIGVSISKLSHWFNGSYSNVQLFPNQIKMLAQLLHCHEKDIADEEGRPLILANLRDLKGVRIWNNY